MIAGIVMFLGVDGKQVGMKMTEYQMAVNSIRVTRRLERNDDDDDDDASQSYLDR